MRWLLNVSAENLNSSTASGVTRRRHGTSLGAASRRGATFCAPAFTSSRNTPRRSSSSASPSGVNTRSTTVVKTSVPVEPDFRLTSVSSVSRRTASPMRIGRWKRVCWPANIRRGSGIGGITPESIGLPSGRRPSGGTRGRK
jgi:hypothetical protein